MPWLNTTITTDKGPQSISINLDTVKYVKQKDDGRALVCFREGQAIVVDDTYVHVMSRVPYA